MVKSVFSFTRTLERRRDCVATMGDALFRCVSENWGALFICPKFMHEYGRGNYMGAKSNKNISGVIGAIGAVGGLITAITPLVEKAIDKVSIDATEQAKLIATNIREGVTILGVEGAMSGSEDMKPQSKEVTPSKEAQTIMPDEEYNCLSQVTVKAIPYVETDNSAGGKTVTIG